MNIIIRETQKIHPGKWADIMKLDKKYNAVEKRLGFPSKKSFRSYFGSHDINTLVIEHEWASMAAFEADVEKANNDAEYRSLEKDFDALIESCQVDVYVPLR